MISLMHYSCLVWWYCCIPVIVDVLDEFLVSDFGLVCLVFCEAKNMNLVFLFNWWILSYTQMEIWWLDKCLNHYWGTSWSFVIFSFLTKTSMHLKRRKFCCWSLDYHSILYCEQFFFSFVQLQSFNIVLWYYMFLKFICYVNTILSQIHRQNGLNSGSYKQFSDQLWQKNLDLTVQNLW